MIVCGWCGYPTEPGASCSSCLRDPTLAYVQRGLTPQSYERARLAEAERRLRADERPVTAETLAEALEIDPRTVRRWREMSA